MDINPIEKTVVNKLRHRRIFGKVQGVSIERLKDWAWKEYELKSIEPAVLDLVQYGLLCWTNKSKKLVKLTKRGAKLRL